MTLQRIALMGAGSVAPSGYSPTHAETTSWLSRVIANGGNASDATLQAMDTFCAAIDAQSGLRGAITRLNLFCGDQLAAALVPLYRAESAGATAKGNATDTNSGSTLFASGNYAASGAAGGITGNGISYLNTGLLPSQVGSGTSGHLSFSGVGYSTTAENVPVGSWDGVLTNNGQSLDDIILAAATLAGGVLRTHYRFGSFTEKSNITPNRSSWAHLIGTSTSVTNHALYEAGSSIASASSSVTAARNNTRSYFVFAINNNGTAGALVSARQRMYSIGSGLTAAQAAAFSAAVTAFNTALGR